MLTVEEYEQIRREVLVDGKSQRAVARELGRSRKTVKKALGHASPPGYRRSQPPSLPVLDPFTGLIDAWLEADRGRPRKQRHTAQRIFERLRDDYGFAGHVSTVRRYVARKKETAGPVFFPLQFAPGEEAQIDWGEARAVVNGVETKVQLFCLRLAHSTASFVRAYPLQRQEMFLDGHVRALEFLGGVPRSLAYDNLPTAVVRVGKGRERELTGKFKELRSHYLFASRFCNPSSGHEKGHAENLVKRAQRSFLTPLPEVASLEDLNRALEAACRRDLAQGVAREGGRSRAELLEEERRRFLPLPATAFPACVVQSTRVDKRALVRFDGNDYSVPVCFARHPVVARGFVDRVELAVDGATVATHPRSYAQRDFVLAAEHYLALLAKKPGAIYHARPFQGQPWGPDLDLFRQELCYRLGGEGMRAYVDVLLCFARFDEAAVRAAVRTCIHRRAFSAEAVQATLEYVPPRRTSTLDLSDRPELAGVGDGTRSLATYDRQLRHAEPVEVG